MRTRPARLLAAALLAAGLALPAAAMEVAVSGERMTLTGDVDVVTTQRVLEALRTNPGIRVVVLENSDGGTADEMILLANLIRERRLETRVSGHCVSACAVMFMGGTRRGLAPGADPARTYVGFHGVTADGVPDEEWNGTVASALHRLSGGRMPRAFAREMLGLIGDGFVAFYHPRHRRGDGGSVAWCSGAEPRAPRDCPSRRGADGVRLGVFTR